MRWQIQFSHVVLPQEPVFQNSWFIIFLQGDVGDLDDVLVQLLELEDPNVRKPLHVIYQTKRRKPLSPKKLVSALRSAL